MGQEDIIKFLRNKRKYYSARELSEKLGKSQTAISHSLVRLRRYRMVKTKTEKRRCQNHYRKMKVYKL